MIFSAGVIDFVLTITLLTLLGKTNSKCRASKK